MTDAATRLAEALVANGFPRMPANVIMALMVSETGALTADALAAELQVSPAAISGAVRYLDSTGMIRRHRPRGERRYVYDLHDHAWYTASISRRSLYGQLTQLAHQAADDLQGDAASRMHEMADFFEFLERRLPEVLAEWQATRS